jgi:hypothetical protein
MGLARRCKSLGDGKRESWGVSHSSLGGSVPKSGTKVKLLRIPNQLRLWRFSAIA